MLYCCAHLLCCLLPALARLHAPHGTCHKVNRRLWDRNWLRPSMKPWNEHGQSPLRTGMQSKWVHIWVTTRNAAEVAESVLSHWPLCSNVTSLQPFHGHTAYIPWWVPEQISKQRQWGLTDTDTPMQHCAAFLSVPVYEYSWSDRPAALPHQWGTKSIL